MNNLYKNKYQIFDGILTKHEEDCFENLILNHIPWYFNSSTSSPNGPYSMYEKNDKNVKIATKLWALLMFQLWYVNK